MKGFKDLYKEVIKGGLFSEGHCSVCGACITVCPLNLLSFRKESFFTPGEENHIDRKEVKEVFNKCIDCGLCYAACPELNFNLKQAETYKFGDFKYSELGYILKILAARSADLNLAKNGQAGGVITTLLKYVLENDIVDGVITTMEDKSNPWKPIPILITKENISELYKTQKSKYFPSATLTALQEVKKKDLKRVAIVVLPCQQHAISKMSISKAFKDWIDRISFSIGVFCLGTYWTGEFYDWLKKKHDLKPGSIEKMYYDFENFIIITKDGNKIIEKREDMYSLTRGSCRLCEDFTNVLADIAVGEIATPDGWSTVIARSEIGREIIDGAIHKDYLQAKSLSIEELRIASEVAKLKYEYHVSKKLFKLDYESFKKKYQLIELPTVESEGMLMLNVLSKTGIDLYSARFKGITDMDDTLIARALSAILQFSKTVFSRNVNNIDLGDMRLIVKTSDNFTLIAVVQKNSKIEQNANTFDKILQELEKTSIARKVEEIIDTSKIEREIDKIVRRYFII